MQSIFGIDVGHLALVLATITGVLLLGIVILAARRRTLLLIGLRNAARRPLRGAVIVAGLMLSTLVVSTAFATGDAMTWTVRSLVAGSNGIADEVITAPQRDFTQLSGNSLDNLSSGTLSIVPSGSFPTSDLDLLSGVATRDNGIAGLLGVYLVQAPVADGADQLAHPGVDVMGVPADTAGVFTLRGAGGSAVDLSTLGPDQVLLNGAAASLLNSGAGHSLRIYLPSQAGNGPADPGVEHDYTVRGILSGGGLAGPEATVFVGLEPLQQALGQAGRLNELLVANSCAGDPVACSERASLALRRKLVDPAAAEAIRTALAGNAGRGVLHRLEARRSGAGRAQVVDLEHTVARGHVTDHLIYLLGDPQVAGTLQAVASFLPTSNGRAFRTLRVLNRLSVVEVSRTALDQANEYGSTLASVFLVLGLFSIAASLLLVFLVFVLLAAERRSELGIARAIGLRRLHLIQSFTFEGVVYDMAAAALGALAGAGVSVTLVWLVARALRRYGIAVQEHIELRSLAVAFCLGLLVTFATVVGSAWRVSRLNIVEAIRGIAAAAAGGGDRSARLTGAVLVNGPLLLIAGCVISLAGLLRHQYLVFALGATVAIAGCALLLRHRLQHSARLGRWSDRLALSGGGAGVLIFWTLPSSTWHAGGTRVAIGSVETFSVAGVMMVFGAVAVIAGNVGAPLQALPRLFARGGAITTAVRMAVAYPLQQRFRTGMAVAMFALVVFTMVVAAVLLDSAQQAYVAREQPPTGYDISATGPPSNDFADINAALAQAPASSPAEFAGLGSAASIDLQVIDPAAAGAAWESATVHLADTGMMQGTPLRLSARAHGYASDSSVWSALASTPATAVLSRGSLDTTGSGSTSPFNNLSYRQTSFVPFALWLRDSTGAPVRLEVIGVADDSSVLPSGLLTLRSNVNMPAAAAASPTTFLFKTAAGRDPAEAAIGLELSFGLRGMQVTVAGEGLRNVETLRRLLNYLLEGFVGLGLVSGVAALGVISTRAVVERRQEIGMMRAIGVRRRLVQAAFVIESSFIALLGVALGVALGLLLASNVIAFLSQSVRQLELVVPWLELLLIAGIAYFAALLTTLVAAWQAGRVLPAEALRYE